MALLDQFDRRALALGALPVGAFVVLIVRCLLPPSVGLSAAVPFAGVLLLSYGPLTYLGLFRAWGDLWTDDYTTSAVSPRPTWWKLSASPWSRLGYSGLHVLGTVWIARLHWGLIDNAKEELRPPPADDLLGFLWHREPPPTGLDLFGEALVVTGIIGPLIFIGLMWFILPSRP